VLCGVFSTKYVAYIYMRKMQVFLAWLECFHIANDTLAPKRWPSDVKMLQGADCLPSVDFFVRGVFLHGHLLVNSRCWLPGQ
tara:strand:+ start:1077 stop:1322 length:246 start_codon:yes stop_codon:yes gene_type:complete